MLDGVTAPTAAGYTFSAGSPAPRSVGWHTVYISFGFDHASQTGHVEWYVNQFTAPNLTLDFDSNSSRWPATNSIAGVAIGSNYSQGDPCTFDNVEFYGGVPEPASLLVLGTGLVGIAGLIRRRR